MNDASHEEHAREIDERMARGEEFVGLVPATVKASASPRAVFSVRLATAELKLISRAAKQRGTPVSDFVRTAALAAAIGDLNLDAAEDSIALGDLKMRLDSLSEAIGERLTRTGTDG